MREQVRIHKHIEDYKKSLSKQKLKGLNYVSSHIVNKIAEDTIHKSLKHIHLLFHPCLCLIKGQYDGG